jgi:hypothetical protein
MCPVARLGRAEWLLLAAASTVLVAGLVSVPFLYDDSGPSSSAPAPTPTVAPSPSPTVVRLSVSQVRITTYARGSHQLVVRARVSTGASASLLVGGRSYPMHLTDGDVTGTVRVACGGPVPALTLVVTTGQGATLSASLGRPTGAFAEACATPRPGAPVPTNSPSRGS